MNKNTKLLMLGLGLELAIPTVDAAKRSRKYAGLVDYTDSEEEAEEVVAAASGASSSASSEKNIFKKTNYIGINQIVSFLDAKSKAQFMTNCTDIHKYQPPYTKKPSFFIDQQVQAISQNLTNLPPSIVELRSNELKSITSIIAQDIFLMDIQPNEAGYYDITLPVAMDMLAFANKNKNRTHAGVHTKIINAFISEYHHPFKTALDNAKTALTPMATLAEAHVYFNNIDETNELERMAARFAWLETSPHAPDLDPTVPLKTIIGTYDNNADPYFDNASTDNGLTTVIDFSHLHAPLNYEIISHLLIDFALVCYSKRNYLSILNCQLDFNDITQPIIIPIKVQLQITNALQSTSLRGLFLPFAKEIYLESHFPVLTSTAGLIAPSLEHLLLCENFEAPQLQSLLIQTGDSIQLAIDTPRANVPALVETNIRSESIQDVAYLQQIITANLAGDPLPNDSENELSDID